MNKFLLKAAPQGMAYSLLAQVVMFIILDKQYKNHKIA